MKKIFTKIFGLNLLFLIIAITFMFVLTNFMYEQLYVRDTEKKMLEVGNKLQTLYTGGEVSDELIELIETHGNFLNYDVFAVRDPKELSACLPFEMDHETIIGQKERQQLILGETVVKIGYEERFGKRVLSVVHPFVEEHRLKGIIYQYYPLEDIVDVAQKGLFITILCAVLFLILAVWISFIAVKKIVSPIIILKQASQKIKQGHYDTRVEVLSKDEIGELGQAFNEMAKAIEVEDLRQKDFLATVSHELRTPLSYIAGYTEGIQKGIIPEEQQQEIWSIIRNETNRMQKLTSDLLGLTHKEVEAISRQPVIIAEVVRQTIQILTIAINEKKLTIHLNLDEEWIVAGDEHLLEQVCINLLENAIRYSKEKSEIRISAISGESEGTLTIQDEGIGIATEDLIHITERFYRVNKARSSSDGGTGLGLTIVKQIVNQHQGQLLFDSELDKGTTIQIVLPNFIV